MCVTMRTVVSAPFRWSSIVLLPIGWPSRLMAKRIVSAAADDFTATHAANTARTNNPAFIDAPALSIALWKTSPPEELGDFKSNLIFSEPPRSFPIESELLAFTALLQREPGPEP